MPPSKNNKTILIAPLDWGLGHATRCIPIIRELQHQNCLVLIAAADAHAVLLKQEFPGVEILSLQGYGIRYGKGNLMLQLFRQLPRFLRTIQQENSWLQKLVTQRRIDGVISDNRYGFYADGVPSIFVTHQLQVQAPSWLRWLQRTTQKSIYRFIENFDECWVPDIANEQQSLAGKLSHPTLEPNIPVHYIGWLTRFLSLGKAAARKYRLVISLSGPEPQRTILETTLLQQLTPIAEPMLLIRGLPREPNLLSHSISNLTVVNHLPGVELQQAIAASDVFLSRCGYSTLMDLQMVVCRCIFIPTPGQTEQEYLGKEIAITGRAVVMQQKDFDLQKALQQAATTPPFANGNYRNKQLPTILSRWLATLH